MGWAWNGSADGPEGAAAELVSIGVCQASGFLFWGASGLARTSPKSGSMKAGPKVVEESEDFSGLALVSASALVLVSVGG